MELAEPFAEVTVWLEEYRRHWEASFQQLDAVLDELKARTKKPHRLRSRTRRKQR